MQKGIWEILSLDIRNIINDAGFETFFEALLNQETHEYKDLQLLLALSEWFWYHVHVPFSEHRRNDVDTLRFLCHHWFEIGW